MNPDAHDGSGTRPANDASTSKDKAGQPAHAPARDERRPFRIVVDVLATVEQVARLQEVFGELLCNAPPEHDGPCRIAWDIGSTGEPEDSDDPDEVTYGYDAEAVAFTREYLSPIEVWDKDEVDRSLGL